MIRSADNTPIPSNRQVGYQSPAEAQVAAYWPGFAVKGMPASTLKDRSVKPRVNYGRWIADCPDPTCAGAELIALTDPRFFCMSCGNDHVDGQWIPIDVPKERVQIETILGQRTMPDTQHWEQGESMDDLTSQNEIFNKMISQPAGQVQVVDLSKI